ncbi:hypothetical protein CN918_30545 [Priestia megaterium]|nr:hypothetical protein CN918_30545 [Priestia megaterium]
MNKVNHRAKLQELDKHAQNHQGECLSTAYTHAADSYRFRCKNGHVWETSLVNIRNGSWCPTCKKKTRAAKKLYSLQAIIKEQGGECLSTVFTHPGDQYHFRCQSGHEWAATMISIQNGSWCPTCRKKEYGEKQLILLQELVQEKEGKLLSTSYTDSYHKLEWQCKEGHTWFAPPGAIKNGSWCRKCHNRNVVLKNNHTIETMKILAKTRGGDCLSPEYLTSRDKLKWECQHGHTWMAEPYSIKRGHWCPTCSKTKKCTIEQMQKIAKSRGGRCLSTTYKNKEAKLTWECAEGHVWEATAGSVHNRNSWCPTCNRQNRPKKYTFKDIQAFAKPYNGKCLSTEYSDIREPLKWQCENGHTWMAAPSHIKSGNWCSACRRDERRQKMLDYYQKIAEERGGKCTSRTYINGSYQLEWECQHGHRWKAYTHNIVAGTWCPTCSNKKKGFAQRPLVNEKKYSIEDMDKLAKQHGGRCLSSTYEDMHTPIKWMCKHSHAWYSAPTVIRRGTWCPLCRRQQDKRIQGFWTQVQQIAKERGGRCVSEEYINKRTKLEWECVEGHRWMTMPETIKKGSWCPTCSYRKK